MGDTKRTYTKKEAAGYLAGMFGQNMIYNIVAMGLAGYYFQYVLHMPILAITVILLIARVWDAFNDPMMGTIVDKTNTKWGKCRPYLIIFPGIIGLVTILCFLNGDYTAETTTQTGKILIVAWAAISYVAWGMVFTVCDIPLWGITSLMTEDENDRSKILGLARIAAAIGGIGALIQPISTAVGGMLGSEKKGFIVVVVVLTVISSILFEFAGLSTRERVSAKEEEKRSIIDNFKIMWNCKPFRQILISGILRSPIQLLMMIAMPLVMYYFLDNNFENIFTDNGINFGLILKIVIFAAGVLVGQFVAMAITPFLTRKFENKSLYNFFSVAGAVPYLMIYVIFKIAGGDIRPIGYTIAVGVCFLFASAAMGGINVLQSVMIADCVDYEEYHKGYRPDGVFFSGQSFITKLSGGIAAIIQGIAYRIVGYEQENITKMQELLGKTSSDGSHTITFVTDYNSYAEVMFLLISVPVAIGMLLSAIPTAKYAMSDKEHTRILNELIERRANAENDSEAVEAESTTEAEDNAAKVLDENMDSIVEEINKLD